MIRHAHAGDAARLADIYNHYVTTTTITFEETPVGADEMRERVEEVQASGLPFLVIEHDARVAGYAHASKWKGRCAYRYSVEISAYIERECLGQGLGSQLYERLMPSLKAGGIHAVIGGIALPNAASVRLHEKFGLRQVATFPQVGFKFGRWIDVGYWQITLGDAKEMQQP